MENGLAFRTGRPNLKNTETDRSTRGQEMNAYGAALPQRREPLMRRVLGDGGLAPPEATV
ncbi:hypothetical protein GCM10010466_58800 [Planomonospora alba]|uniref:Uncharacterized protein n=1 Tax=Planomonospora alba TaxID=161354 RepID=A0ABP6NYK3_9ACTN